MFKTLFAITIGTAAFAASTVQDDSYGYKFTLSSNNSLPIVFDAITGTESHDNRGLFADYGGEGDKVHTLVCATISKDLNIKDLKVRGEAMFLPSFEFYGLEERKHEDGSRLLCQRMKSGVPRTVAWPNRVEMKVRNDTTKEVLGDFTVKVSKKLF